MDIDLLKTFLEVNRTRHFGKAADNLFVTQSTVSTRIRLLEETVGAPVFTRTRHDIQLTATGQRLLRFAETIVTTWNRARQEIAVEDESRIALTLGGVPSLWDIALQDWLQRTHDRFPHLVLQADVLGVELMSRRLLDGTLDVAFMFEAPQISGLELVEITRVPLIMVSSQPGHSAAQAVGDNYILVDWGTSFATAHAQHFPDMRSPSLRIGLGRIARDLILACGGTAYLAEPMVRHHISSGRLHVVEDAPVIRRSATAAHSLTNDKSALIAELLELFAATGRTSGDNHDASPVLGSEP